MKTYENKNFYVDVYFSLNEFINDMKKICNENEIDFNECFGDFIEFIYNDLHLSMYDKITIHKYDDMAYIFTNNEKNVYFWFD